MAQHTSVTRRQANDNMAQLYTGLAVCTATNEAQQHRRKISRRPGRKEIRVQLNLHGIVNVQSLISESMDDFETRRDASSTSEVNAKSDHTPAVANDDEATRDLLKCATDYKMVVGSLPSSVRDAVIEECNKVEQWLQEKTREQDSLPKDADPILWSSEIKRKLEALDATCKYIMRSKPSPQGRDEANGPDRRRKSDDMQVD
ncbi:hypothetical protein LWI29_020291 [Acer saccharum]|uniref:Uncharacterized protein n=1 Tax=Acer saccharum TaxID=4024 RepID=A0AA39RSI1_ACESA|nr:hypothetical protein LWI29_020291 [Acer saccharum]